MSARDRLAAALARWSGRPTLVAVAVVNALTGIAIAAYLAPAAFGADADLFRRCALVVAEGRAGSCGTSLLSI